MEHAAQVEYVLVNEIDNQNGVHLYLEGNKWCAYERSAYYLAQLKVPVVIKKEIVRDGYDVILLKAFFEVDDMLLFQLNDQIDGFPEWKACQLNKLPA